MLSTQKIEAIAPINIAGIVSKRFIYLDAFRGFVMLMMCTSHGFGFTEIANHSGFAGWIATLFIHAPWTGLHFLDLIQPAFMFIVGIAMAFTFTSRRVHGESFKTVFLRVFKRFFALLILSQIIISISSNQLQFQLINVLSQIALCYLLCFFIMQLNFRWQVFCVVMILSLHWTVFIVFHGPDGSYSQNDNIGAILDRYILGKNYPGFYVTLNFISSTVTTLFGLWTGLLLMNKQSPIFKMKMLLISALLCLILGILLEPFNPMIKRLWTESFTFFSMGWVLLMLLFFYWLAEVKQYHRLVFPLTIVGMNSIFIYCLTMVLYPWLDNAVALFTNRFFIFGDMGTIFQGFSVVFMMWYICYLLYRYRIFFKV